MKYPCCCFQQSIKLEDNVPRVQPTPQSIDYEVAPQSNLLQYVDHGGYKTDLGSEVEVRQDNTIKGRERGVRELGCSPRIVGVRTRLAP